MGAFAYTTNNLTPRNTEREIKRMTLQMLGVTTGDTAEFHRHLQALIHCDSAKVKKLARWW